MRRRRRDGVCLAQRSTSRRLAIGPTRVRVTVSCSRPRPLAVRSKRRRICWITPAYFLAVDAPIIPRLLEHYDVDWLLIHTRDDSSHALTDGLRVDWSCVRRSITLRYRQRDPRIIGQYLSLTGEIRQQAYDLVYTSFHGMPYFLPVLAARVDVQRIIYAVHNATTPKGASNEWAMRLYHRYTFRTFRRFHVFSETQLAAIASLAPGATHYCAPFPLVDYGTPRAVPPEEPIRFLFFGHIRRYKRLDLLVDAFKRLRGITPRLELQVAGACNEWDRYRDLIGDAPDIVARVEVVPVADIPDLFGSSHYVVLPYQDIAQSAVLKLAFQYGKPVIVSNIDGFRQSVVQGKTGVFFESGSADDLTAVLRDVVANHGARYREMQENVRQLAAREYSLEGIVTRYRAFIDDAMESRPA